MIRSTVAESAPPRTFDAGQLAGCPLENTLICSCMKPTMKHDVPQRREVRQALAQGVGITDPCGQAQEGGMSHYSIRRWVFVSLLGGIFALGFVSGAVSQRPAQAQIPGLGGALGSVQELGSSIVEIQQHVDGLQKNVATLKKVQGALG